MKVLFGVLLTAYFADAAVFVTDLENHLGNLPVTKFYHPGFVDRTYTEEEMKDCIERLGRFVKGKFEGTLTNYNLSETLSMLGGAPGEVQAVKKNDVTEPSVADPSKRPLDDAPEDKWLYNYRSTDYKYYYRLEHAVKRFVGTDKEFQDVRGQLAWTPEDTCGKVKVADYRLDDTGFHSEVKHDYCWFGGKQFTCASIAHCDDGADGTQVCTG